MKKLSSIQKKYLMMVLVLFLLSVSLVIWMEEKIFLETANNVWSSNDPSSENGVIFSAESGFYDRDFTLQLKASGASQILFTMNGSDPTESGTPYTQGIRLSAEKDVSVYVISACAVYPDGTVSKKSTRSYFLSRTIEDRFDCLVFSVSIDPDELYNYEDGIFVSGKMRDDFLAENPELSYEDLQPNDPANWNQRGIDSEREAYVEVYENNGTCVISQPCGLRVVGGHSRARDPKSIRLYARSEYHTVNIRFRYEFFPDAKDSQGQIINSYKRLNLRSCGNDKAGSYDYGYLYMREDLTSFLIHPTGVNAKYSRPAVVFLNGEYHGFVWVQQVISEDLLDHTYNLEESEWDILFGDGNKWLPETENGPWTEVFDDWIRVCDYAYMDLTDDILYEKLCQELDVENFLTYYALNAYVANYDWPWNNIKMFRYSKNRNAPIDMNKLSEEAQKICDGRWRFFSYDTDYAFGLRDELPADQENFRLLFNEQYFNYQDGEEADDYYECYARSDLLMALCKRKDVRERFLSIVCDMMNWHFNPDRVTSAMDGYHNWRLQELTYAAAANKADIHNLSVDLETAKTWIQQRPEYVLKQLESIFPEYTEYVTVSVKPIHGAEIQINSISLEEESGDFTGLYHANTSISVDCSLEPGCIFDHWEVNGKIVKQKSFVLDLKDPQIIITLHTYRMPTMLRFNEVCYKGDARDYFIITNYGSEAVSTAGMYISDGKMETPYYLPKIRLDPGESRVFVCAGYAHVNAIGQLQTNFNLKEGETLTLYAADNSIIHSFFLGECSNGNYLKYCIRKNRFEEFPLADKQNRPAISGF